MVAVAQALNRKTVWIAAGAVLIVAVVLTGTRAPEPGPRWSFLRGQKPTATLISEGGWLSKPPSASWSMGPPVKIIKRSYTLRGDYYKLRTKMESEALALGGKKAGGQLGASNFAGKGWSISVLPGRYANAYNLPRDTVFVTTTSIWEENLAGKTGRWIRSKIP